MTIPIKELTYESVALLTDKEVKDLYENKFKADDYYQRYVLKREMKIRTKRNKIQTICNKGCDNCTVKLLCSLSSPTGSVLARDKVDMKLSYVQLQYDMDVFNIPAIRANFHFSSLAGNTYMHENISMFFRLLPTQYNTTTNKYERIALKDLPHTQIDYDKYDTYYLEYDNLLSMMYYIDYQRSDTRERLLKLKCPILLEAAFDKAIKSINRQAHNKLSFRKYYYIEDAPIEIRQTLKDIKTKYKENYVIFSLAQMKKNSLYTPADISPMTISKTEIKRYQIALKHKSLFRYPVLSKPTKPIRASI